MIGSRVYLQPMRYVIDTIHDIKEMQKGKGTFADIPNGKINFLVKLYWVKWEYRFTVTDVGKNCSKVEIEIADDVPRKEDKILREFALLDSMLTANTQIELAEKKDDG